MRPWEKYPHRWRLMLVLATFLIGIVIGATGWLNYSVYYFFAGVVLAGLGIYFRTYGWSVACLTVALLAIGLGWSSWHLSLLTLSTNENFSGRATILSSKFTTAPKQRVILKVVDGVHKNQNVSAFVYDWHYANGTVLNLTATLNPSDFKPDLGSNTVGQLTNISVSSIASAPDWLFRFRQFMLERMDQSLPEPYASFAIGLLTGANDSFDSNFKTDLQRTGTTHLVAVSGYNLTIVALVLLELGQRKSRNIGVILAITGIVIYVLLAGTGASILRGAIIAGLSLFAKAAGRPIHRTQLILLGAAILAALTPLGILYSVSWQLSFAAFVGIVYIQPVLEKYLKRFGTIGVVSSETLAAEVTVLPLLLSTFGMLSPISPLVNLVVLWLTPLAMFLSFVQVAVTMVWLTLGRLFVWLSWGVLAMIIKPIQWSSSLPFAAYTVRQDSWLVALAAYTIISGLVLLMWRTPKKVAAPMNRGRRGQIDES